MPSGLHGSVYILSSEHDIIIMNFSYEFRENQTLCQALDEVTIYELCRAILDMSKE